MFFVLFLLARPVTQLWKLKNKEFQKRKRTNRTNGSDLNRLRRKLKVDWAVENATETPEKRQPANNWAKHWEPLLPTTTLEPRNKQQQKKSQEQRQQRREMERNGNERGKVTCQLCPFSHSLSPPLFRPHTSRPTVFWAHPSPTPPHPLSGRNSLSLSRSPDGGFIDGTLGQMKQTEKKRKEAKKTCNCTLRDKF